MAKIAEVQEVARNKLVPYERNAKIHSDDQVQKIADSIREFGFLSPCLIDRDYNIIAGHGRVMAAELLGMETVPCIFIEGLTDDQRRAYILADNRLTELGEWDMETVTFELRDLSADGFDVELTGFDVPDDWFQRDDRWDRSGQDGNDEYNDFIAKFEPKKTTDDCYTPDNVYDAVAEWVAKEYGLSRESFVRPFYPGGDYTRENYAGKVVVDNPPFSILAQIMKYYIENGVRFFLFAPALTLFSGDRPEVCHVCAGCRVTYENGAVVRTGFKTNLEDGIAVRTAPELTAAVMAAEKENTQSDTNLLKYDYPANVITAAKVSNWGEALIDYKVPRAEAVKISALDAQKAKGLSIFGSGFLLSAAQAAQAARVADEAARAAQAAQAARAAQAAQAARVADGDINEDGQVVWRLSERELEIIEELGRHGE